MVEEGPIMTYLPRARWAAIAVAALACLAGQPASASDTAYAQITISKDAKGAVTVTPPGAGSTPSAWSCATDDQSSAVQVKIAVTCVPASGTWTCRTPYLLGTYAGAPGTESATGTTSCATKVATCTAQENQAPYAVGYCEAHVPDGGALSAFVCKAEYNGLQATVEWSILCRTYRG
jgi:hypothetical protein